jgi:hypothetical protein
MPLTAGYVDEELSRVTTIVMSSLTYLSCTQNCAAMSHRKNLQPSSKERRAWSWDLVLTNYKNESLRGLSKIHLLPFEG